MNPTLDLRFLALIFLIVGLPAMVGAQPDIKTPHCASNGRLGSLSLTIAAQTSDAPTAGPGPHWVVLALPAESAIEVADPALLAAINAWVARQNSLPPEQRHDWILDGKNNANLFKSREPGALAPVLASQFTITFTELKPPTTSGPSQTVKIPFCFSALAPPPSLNSIDVQVLTRLYVAAPAGANKMSEQLTQLEQGVTAHALITDQDFSNDAEKRKLLTTLEAVARNAFQIARSEGLRPGASATSSLQTQVEQAISQPYVMQNASLPGFVTNWPNIRAHTYFPQPGNLVLEIVNVSVAKSARIEVDLGGIQPASQKGVSRAQALACKTERRLNARFAPELASFAYAVPTFDQIDTLRGDIALVRDINPSTTPVGVEAQQPPPGANTRRCSNAQPGNDPRVIIFYASNRWRSFGFKLSGGIGYSPEQKVAGTGSFEADNIFLKLRDNDQPRETESVSYTGGNEIQKLEAQWALDWSRDHASLATSTYGLHLFADYLRDNDQRFGNILGPPLRDRERGITLSGVYSFTSKPVDSDGNPVESMYRLAASAGLEYRRINVDPSGNAVVPPLASGSMTAAFMDLTLNYRYDPVRPAGGGIGGLDLSLTSHLNQGFKISDFAFTQFSAAGLVTLYFGPTHPRDLFIRFRQGIGSGNRSTPLFKLFRLGGPETLRGMEQGEFVGRKTAYQQFEAGISIRQILSWLPHKPTSRAGSNEQQPFDLSRFYVKGFYDRGLVTDSASLSDLLFFRHAAKGYGFAVEIHGLQAGSRRVVLSIGYAKSPESVLHRSGTAITSASISF